MSLTQYLMIFGGSSLFGAAVIFWLFKKINSMVVTHVKALEIAKAIREGAMTFLKEEYKVIAIVDVTVAVILGVVMSPLAALVFMSGSTLSLFAGYVGMRAATSANVRTTMAAKNKGERAAFYGCLFWRRCHGLCRCKLWLAWAWAPFLSFC